ncbi:hypothetical protein EVAR_62175_1 [Eumeta japonica]|uniref:Uncharacterized protein n=1 Tax=Eumeta variegata TaxID=151549 RepID=A0A4C1ZQ72_EUMVA|nr:hypothetical protein EVAR_62175_1 [Eumeta japonica]
MAVVYAARRVYCGTTQKKSSTASPPYRNTLLAAYTDDTNRQSRVHGKFAGTRIHYTSYSAPSRRSTYLEGPRANRVKSKRAVIVENSQLIVGTTTEDGRTTGDGSEKIIETRGRGRDSAPQPPRPG